MISPEHVSFIREMIEIPGALGDPALVFGFCDPSPDPAPTRWAVWKRRAWLWFDARRTGAAVRLTARRVSSPLPEAFRGRALHETVRAYGVREVKVLDLFDARADLQLDMNLPLPPALRGAFGSVFDLGSGEHVFDTRQCFENLFDFLRVGGCLFLQTPCGGCHNHGLHTLSPECVLQCLERNGFEILLTRYSSPHGIELSGPFRGTDILLWAVARKVSQPGTFQVPQQGRWAPRYRQPGA